MDIYSKDNEEVYIATSPSFSIVGNKCTDDMYSLEHDSCSNLSDNNTSNFDKNENDNRPTLTCMSNNEELEYSSLKSINTYPIVNNIDGQNYLLSSDFSQLDSLGVETSKTFYYVLSPIETVNTLIRSSNNDTTTTTRSNPNNCLATSVITDDGDPISPRTDSISVHVDLTQSELSTNNQHVDGEFDQLNNEYHVEFIHGISDQIDSPNKERSQLVWQPLTSNNEEQNKNCEHNHQLVMKYNHSSKVELPSIIHGQPYLQVALVNDMDTSSASELVSTDQILGVTVPELFTCKWDGCGVHFLTRQDLVKHSNTLHLSADNGGSRYICHWKGCVREGKQFDARYKMLTHLRTHTGEKPNICPVEGCTSAFSRIENLKIHLRTHTGERPYPCLYEGCDKSFANSSDRFKHRRTHSERKPYKCPFKGCEKSYTDPSSLRKHRKRHTIPDPKKL